MRLHAACVGMFLGAACGGARDPDTRTVTREVEAQLEVVKGATIPTGVTLLNSSGPSREGQSVSAEWSFELPGEWRQYAEQADASLRKGGYEPSTMSDSDRAFNKHVPGDSYRVQVRYDASSRKTRVTVRFWARPD